MKKLVPANVSTKKEFYQRMLDGEVFHLTGATYSFEEAYTRPFIRRKGNLLTLLRSDVPYSALEVEIEVPWYEDIPPNGVLCWCWDGVGTINLKKNLRIITHYESDTPYTYRGDSCGNCWKYATPVTVEEIAKYVLKE